MEERFIVGAVQAAPVFLDLAASTDKAAALIHEAGASGARLLGFPEGFIPGHPGWVELLPFDARSERLGQRLFLNAVEVPSSQLEALASACAAAKVDVVMGICQRRPGTTGTLYNTQVHIDATGLVHGVHQKIVPTVGERLVHAPGTTGPRCSFRATVGPVTSLICGENSNPLNQYAAALEYPVAHIASWPPHFSPGLDMGPVIQMVSRALAYSLKTHVLNCVMTVSDEMRTAYGQEHTDFLAESPGRASIVGPSGNLLAEAQDGSEQIVYAEIAAADLIIPKFVHDVAGHYSRPELFRSLFE
ncbi:MAG: nitrilase/cyanide hydratase and apolipoprotein N-acyltransferase [Acidimicrobiia bacterium]|nr:nitrilase/cyanide hydratase and apolipoprotein N-acyltransferase [Acidimicrobiia bacterium]MDH4306410.1 nitrilase/cyanide hydratase and apolipoprotein N-acyltransferase [Acidimicrobiia bacterium]